MPQLLARHKDKEEARQLPASFDKKFDRLRNLPLDIQQGKEFPD